MKYYGYFTDNHDCRYRQPAQHDIGAKIEFESLEDLYKYAILIYAEETNWDEYLEECELNDVEDVQELEDMLFEQDLSMGAPFLFYAEDSQNRTLYDVGALDPDVPAPYRLAGEEIGYFDGNLDINIPHKIISLYFLIDDEDEI